MHFLENFNNKTLNYDLLNKFSYKNLKKLPKLKKIIINFGCKTNDIKSLSLSLLALEYLTGQKSKLTTTKKANLVLKLRKGNPVGCQVILRKKNLCYFLEKILNEAFPKLKNFVGFNLSRKIKKISFTCTIEETLSFSELEKHYSLFNNLPNLKITFITTAQTRKELLFILKSYKINVKKLSKYNSIW